MSDFSRFMKSNKAKKENVFYPAVKAFTDENGKPLMWEFKHLSSREMDEIRNECLIEVPVSGKRGQYKAKFDGAKFNRKMLAESTVYPDLNNAELQISYGAKNPEELILEMVDDPREYNALLEFIQQLNGLSESLQDKVDDAKNS